MKIQRILFTLVSSVLFLIFTSSATTSWAQNPSETPAPAPYESQPGDNAAAATTATPASSEPAAKPAVPPATEKTTTTAQSETTSAATAAPTPATPPADERELAQALNTYNFPELFNHIIGNRYSSHGCVHLSPTSIYILYNIVPAGCTLVIQPYNVVVDEKALANVPYLETLLKNEDDLKRLKEKLKNPANVKIEALPRSEKWILYYKNQLFAQFDISTGPSEPYFMFLGKDDAGTFQYDDLPAGPTSPNTYTISYFGDYFYAPSYRDTTIIPQDALIKKIDGKWLFEKDKKWQACPTPVADDLDRLAKKEPYDYYYYDIVHDESNALFECRWSAHDFGKYVIGWTWPGGAMSNEVAHTNGLLIKEQLDLIKDLSVILTDALAVDDDFDLLISRHTNFSMYKNYANFLQAPDRFRANEELVLYKLYSGWLMFPEDLKIIEPGILAAYKLLQNSDREKWILTEEENNALVTIGAATRENGEINYNLARIRGILAYIKKNKTGVEKFAFWYNYLKEIWPNLTPVREIFKRYFQNKPEIPEKLQQNVIYQLFRIRTNFKIVTPAIISEILKKETEKLNSGLIYE